MTTHDENPIIRTTSRRMAKGLAIIVVVIGLGAAIAVPNWHNFAKNPPPVSMIRTQPEGGGAGSTAPAGGTSSSSSANTAGATTITILQGASTQGNPNFEPADGKVPLGNKVIWQNKDTVPHTATSGTGPSDPKSGKIFDTKIINNGESSSPQVLKTVKTGESIPYYCQIHPYMTAKLTISAASAGANTKGTSANTAVSGGKAASGGPTLSILQGASIQGNPAYSPDPLTVKKGDTIQVTNKDTVLHTVTNGKGPDDPTSGKLFDTSIINAGQSSTIATTKLNSGQQYPFHCSVHPYMTGVLKVQ